jgi:hypothetical protein
MPDEMINSSKSKIGSFWIKCNPDNFKKYAVLEACNANANFVNIINAQKDKTEEDLVNYQADIYNLPEYSLLYKRLDYLNSDKLSYNESSKLNWSDINGIVNSEDNLHIAYIVTILHTNEDIDIWTGNMSFTCQSIVFRDKSWVKPDYKNDNTLIYLQTMFDIAELQSLEYLYETNLCNANANYREIKSILYNNIFKMYKTQELMDKETNYGKDVQKVKIWSEKIKTELIEARKLVHN